ncbi:MAG: hypothetical protein IJI05_01070 [Erysipelotrichaceae bacterium]|nr:hypothetical protein [Erysipelotrichaceae bacterium]
MAKMKPVYVFSGFLDAGKTTAIKESLLDPRFTEDETTLIVAFEQGDEVYAKPFLFDTYSSVVYLDGISELTEEKIVYFEDEYNPDRIIIELNGMQDDTKLFANGSGNWEIADYLTFFDATTLKSQMLNMKQFVFNHVINSFVCYINRCTDQDLLFFRNNLKGINRNLMVVFLDDHKKIINIESQMFDVSKPLDINDDDYGLWYIDAVDNPDKYNGCQIKVKLKYLETVRAYKNTCIMGREAMVCCSNDLQQIGITCMGVNPDKIKKNTFYTITGNLKSVYDEEGTRTVIIKAEKLEEAPRPEDEYVNFN